MKVVSVLFLVSTLLAVAYADLPVHCLYSQTKGDWQFFVTAQDSDKSVVAKCGIRTPITPTSNFNVNLGVSITNLSSLISFRFPILPLMCLVTKVLGR